MEAVTLLNELEKLGVSVTVEGDRLILEPGSQVPSDLVPELKSHKQELMSILKLRGYRLKYRDTQSWDKELEEIAARVEFDGYVLLWSTVLCDLIAFYRNNESKHSIPPGFIPYSVAELRELFDKGECSENRLRLIHEAKKQGALMISHNPNEDFKAA